MIVISYNVLQKRLIYQKYKKCFPGKYALLLCVAVSIRWISIRFDLSKGKGLQCMLMQAQFFKASSLN